MGDHPLGAVAQEAPSKSDTGAIARGDAEHGVTSLAEPGIGEHRAGQVVAGDQPAVDPGRGFEPVDRAALVNLSIELVWIPKV